LPILIYSPYNQLLRHCAGAERLAVDDGDRGSSQRGQWRISSFGSGCGRRQRARSDQERGGRRVEAEAGGQVSQIGHGAAVAQVSGQQRF
jgi:hypothetical protein